jgi:hypothetical protein
VLSGEATNTNFIVFGLTKQKKTTNVQTNKKEEQNKTSEIQKKPNANEHIM